MALLAIAIVGKNNEPLYLCDCNFDASEEKGEGSPDGEEDYFGFSEESSKGVENNLSLDNEFMMYAALDHLDEALGIHPGVSSRRQTGSHWIGFLCPVGDAKCYGYATATNVKIIAVVQDPSESKLKSFFSKIHDHYVHYTMNPFSKIQGKVVSKKFNQGVRDAVADYNKSTASKHR